jgi:O-antigen/teichoic acid export membrane protein
VTTSSASAKAEGRQILESSLLYTAGDFLGVAVASFLLIPIYTRFISPEQFGLYGTVMALISILGSFMGMGLPSAVGRYYFIYAPQGKAQSYLGATWFFQTAFSFGAAVILLLFAGPLWGAVAPAIPFRPYGYLVLAGGLLTFGANIYMIWLRVQERATRFVTIQITAMIFNVMMVCILVVWLRLGALGSVLGTLSVNILLASIAILFLAPWSHWRWNWSLVRPTLGFAGASVMGTVGYLLLNKSQLFFLQKYQDLTTTGLFNLGQQLGSVIALISVSFAKAWQPAVYRMQSAQDASRAIAAASKYFIAAMLYVTLGVIFLSNEILLVLSDRAYQGAGLIFRLAATASFIYILATLSNTALLYQKRAGLVQITLLVSVAANILLNALLVPRWGMLGAGCAMACSFGIMTIISFIIARIILPVSYPWRQITRILLIGLALIAVEWSFAPDGAGPISTSIRVGLLIAFPFLLCLSKTISVHEIGEAWIVVKGFWAKAFKALKLMRMTR